MGVCTVCNELATIQHDACVDRLDIGNRIKVIMYQKLTGADFDGQAGNDLFTPADVNSKINAVGDDKLYILPNLNFTLPATEPTLLGASESVTGVDEPIEYSVTGNGFVQYITQQDFNAFDVLTYCSGLVRAWFITDTGAIFGAGIQDEADLGQGFESVKFTFSSLNLGGVGTLANVPFTVKYTERCNPKYIGTDRAFTTLTNAGFTV